jgi:hypothetical protein
MRATIDRAAIVGVTVMLFGYPGVRSGGTENRDEERTR